MEEKEIIKWNGNYKTIAKNIVKISIILTIICFVLYGIFEGIYNIKSTARSNKMKELEKIRSEKQQIASEKYEIYSKKNSKKSEIWTSISNKSSYKNFTENLNNSEEYQKILSETEEAYNIYKEAKEEATKAIDTCLDFSKNSFVSYPDTDIYIYIGIGFGIFAIITLVFYWYVSKMEITVTNTRVYGKKAFGKRVDLPIDTISVVGTSFLRGIDIGTSSGKIHFKGIKNNNEIHTEITNLLNKRQELNKETVKEDKISTTEELKSYKELLDSGVITQEEVDAKKKQLLDL